MDASLTARMDKLLIREADLVEKYVLGSGSGGQKINKTASCVYLRHTPTGIEIHCQDSRSRDRNREIARQRLCERIEEKRKKEFLDRAKARAKARYARRKPSAATKAKLKQSKIFRSDKKKKRRKVTVKNYD